MLRLTGTRCVSVRRAFSYAWRSCTHHCSLTFAGDAGSTPEYARYCCIAAQLPFFAPRLTPHAAPSSPFALCSAPQNDSIEGIYDTLKECACISKSAGGIGLSIHNLRAAGTYIRGTNGTSNGIVPMLRVFNDTARCGAHVANHGQAAGLTPFVPGTWWLLRDVSARAALLRMAHVNATLGSLLTCSRRRLFAHLFASTRAVCHLPAALTCSNAVFLQASQNQCFAQVRGPGRRQAQGRVRHLP